MSKICERDNLSLQCDERVEDERSVWNYLQRSEESWKLDFHNHIDVRHNFGEGEGFGGATRFDERVGIGCGYQRFHKMMRGAPEL